MADRYFRDGFCATICGPTNTEFCRFREYNGEAKQTEKKVLLFSLCLFFGQKSLNFRYNLMYALHILLNKMMSRHYLPLTVYKLDGPGMEPNRPGGICNDIPIEHRENDGLCAGIDSISTNGHDERCCC